MLTIINQNKTIILENIAAWFLAIGVTASQIMPLFQILAYATASIVSILTAIKVLKDLFKKQTNDNGQV